MGGGLGWLGRKYGLNAGGIRAAEIVTANGELLRVTPDEHSDLFGGLGGGAGNFGIVTSLEFALHPLTTLYGGNLFYPIELAPELLAFYAAWSADLPDEMASGIAFMNLPPLPVVPEPLRGKSVVAVRACYCGKRLDEGKALMAVWRVRGLPIMDTLSELPFAAIDAISMDPVDPMPGIQYSDLLGELSPAAIATLLDVAGADSGSPLTVLELRQLGGALRRSGDQLYPLGQGEPRFLMNGVGAVFAPEMARAIRGHLTRVAEATRPYQTGTYINFLELDDASPARVRAAYSPADWARLVDLKDRYDPENRFRFNRNIPPST